MRPTAANASRAPKIDGIDSFKGATYHTGTWPHEGIDFSGLRVGVIGTGASGVQIVPVVAPAAAHLTVFQRTPNWCVPINNAPLSDEYKRWVKEHYPEIRDLQHEVGPAGIILIDEQITRPDPRGALHGVSPDRLALGQLDAVEQRLAPEILPRQQPGDGDAERQRHHGSHHGYPQRQLDRGPFVGSEAKHAPLLS